MSLSLPEDAEAFIPTGEDLSILSTSGVYALRLTRPDDLAEVWERYNDHRPDYWEDLIDADGVVYVGAAKNVLQRLTQHKKGKIKKANVVQVCSIDSIRNIWWFDSTTRAFERESGLATAMQNEYPHFYVHSR